MKEIIKMHNTAIIFPQKSTKMPRSTDDMVFNCRKRELRNNIEYHRKIIKRRTEIRNKSRDSV